MLQQKRRTRRQTKRLTARSRPPICRFDRGRDEPQRGGDPKSIQPSESHTGKRPTRSESEREGKMSPRPARRPWTADETMPSLPSVRYQQPQSRMILETPLAHECSGIKLSAVVCICSIEAEGDQSFPSGG